MRFVRTYKARKAFLDQLAVGSSVSFAAQSCGATVSVMKRWRESDEEFAKDWDDAIEEGTDMLEDEAFQRAFKKSDPLMMFMLKARRPEKFDRGGKLELSGGINVEGAKAKLLNRIARLQAEGRILPGNDQAEPEISGDQSEEATPEERPTRLLPAPDPAAAVLERGRKRRSVEQPDRRKAAKK